MREFDILKAPPGRERSRLSRRLASFTLAAFFIVAASGCIVDSRRYTRTSTTPLAPTSEMLPVPSFSQPELQVQGDRLIVRTKAVYDCRILQWEQKTETPYTKRSIGAGPPLLMVAGGITIGTGIDEGSELTTKIGAGIAGAGVLGYLIGWIASGTSEGDPTISVKEKSRSLNRGCRTERQRGREVLVKVEDGDTIRTRTDSEGAFTVDVRVFAPKTVKRGRRLAVFRIDGIDRTFAIEPGRSLRKQLSRAIKKARLQDKPPKLVISASLDDGLGNGDGRLDAEEKAVLVVRVRNEGKGHAFDVHVSVAPKGTAAAHVAIPSRLEIGTIKPGTAIRREVSISAGEFLPSGKLQVELSASEEMGFGTRWPTVFKVATVRLPEPRLSVGSIYVYDGESAYAQGNGNGVVEPGEQVELRFRVNNNGEGTARGVTVVAGTRLSNVRMKKQKANLGKILTSRAKQVSISFAVPSDYRQGKQMPFKIALTEARPRFSRAHEVTLVLGELRRPVDPETGSASLALPDVDKPIPGVSIPRPGSVALVIGIEDYLLVSDVPYARADAKVVGKYLKKSMGWDYVKKPVLDRYATKSSLEHLFYKWLPLNLKPDGDVFVYFSGHGLANAKGEPYLLAYDARAGDAAAGGIKLESLLALLDKATTGASIVVVDACYVSNDPAVTGGTHDIVLVKKARARDVTLFTAAGPDQRSNKYAPAGHGLFTYYLLEGLRGAAAGRDGAVTLGELFDYVRPKVRDAAAREGAAAEQVPQLTAPRGMKNHVLVRYE